jgi:hypothetical protein
MNYTSEDIKCEEFLTKCYELSDKIATTNTRSVTITTCQLQFYGKTITDVMQMFKSFLTTMDGPTDAEDYVPFTWHVYANKVGDKYQLKFIHRLVITTN